MRTDSFRDFAPEQRAGPEALRCKRIFGGEQFFGIVYDGRLYFKTYPDTLPEDLHHHSGVFAPSERAWQ